MKLNKIFAVALAALTMTACSDDDKLELNTASGVSVAMEDATFTIGENVDLFNVPTVSSPLPFRSRKDPPIPTISNTPLSPPKRT